MKTFTIAILGLLLSSISYSQNVIAPFGYDEARAVDEVNDPLHADAYPWISPDGLRLYFTREGEDQQSVLMFTRRSNADEKFSEPVELPLKGAELAVSFTIAPDELGVYACTKVGEIIYYRRAGLHSDFGPGQKLTLNGHHLKFISSASFSPAMNELYLFSSIDHGELCQFRRTAENTYDFVRVMSFPEEYDVSPGQLSPDGLSYYFSAEILEAEDVAGETEHIYRLTRSSLAEPFDVLAIQELTSLNDHRLDNLQPSVSAAGAVMVFTKNPMGVWENNDIYIAARTGSFAPITDTRQETPINVFPNPTPGTFQIEGQDSPVLVNIFDNMGAMVYSGTYVPGTEIDLSKQANGVYYMRIYGSEGVTSRKVYVAH